MKKHFRSVSGFARLAALILAALHELAAASEQSGRVVYVAVRASDGLVYVSLDGPRTERPVCATQTYWILKSEASSTGRQQYAALLAAKVAGKNVRVYGSAQCTRWGDGEDIDGIFLLD